VGVDYVCVGAGVGVCVCAFDKLSQLISVSIALQRRTSAGSIDRGGQRADELHRLV